MTRILRDLEIVVGDEDAVCIPGSACCTPDAACC